MSKAEKIHSFDPNSFGVKNNNFIGLPFDENEADIILLPVPWDVTVSYNDGTATAAQNILEASYQLDLYDEISPNAWQKGIYMLLTNDYWLQRNAELRPKAKKYIDFLENGGNIQQDNKMQAILEEINASSENLKNWVYENTKKQLSNGKFVGLIGGEHSVPLGYFAALLEKHESFGILQIDAHQDLREAYEGFTYSHASIFYNASQLQGIEKIVQVGIRDTCDAEMQMAAQSNGRIQVFSDFQIRNSLFNGKSYKNICQKIIATLPQKVYISFDIDGLSPDLCPNTGTPVPGGFSFNEAIFLLHELKKSNKQIIGFDLCETAGIGHEWDGNVAARILYKLCGVVD